MHIQYITEVMNVQQKVQTNESVERVKALFECFRSAERTMNVYIQKANLLFSGEEQIQRLQAKLTNATAKIGEVYVSRGASTDRLADDILRLVQLKINAASPCEHQSEVLSYLRGLIVNYAQMLGACLQVLEAMPETNLREALLRHYIVGESWERVAERMNYSERRIYDLRENGLQMAAEIYDSFLQSETLHETAV